MEFGKIIFLRSALDVSTATIVYDRASFCVWQMKWVFFIATDYYLIGLKGAFHLALTGRLWTHSKAGPRATRSYRRMLKKGKAKTKCFRSHVARAESSSARAEHCNPGSLFLQPSWSVNVPRSLEALENLAPLQFTNPRAEDRGFPVVPAASSQTCDPSTHRRTGHQRNWRVAASLTAEAECVTLSSFSHSTCA